jgi:hypothetical protein
MKELKFIYPDEPFEIPPAALRVLLRIMLKAQARQLAATQTLDPE